MNYSQAIKILFEKLPVYQKVGKPAHTKKLDNILKLCSYLDNPQNNYDSIHIAGTNGKGSSVAILSALLTASGKKVGCYSSPHIYDFRERIRVGDKLIAKDDVVFILQKVLPYVEKSIFSFFEITVAMAFTYFKNEKIDIAIIETGLGGRLDSTNIINPFVTLITSIDYDHQDLLGNTIEEIAYEKAGIIKENTPCILNTNNNKVIKVIEKKAVEKSSKLYHSNEIFTITKKKKDSIINIYYNKTDAYNKQLNTIDGLYPITVGFPLYGDHQIDNLKGALATFHLIVGGQVNAKQIINGFKLLNKKEFLPFGRCQIVSKSPWIIIDVSHNNGGIKALFDSIKNIKYKSIYCIIAFSKDKNINDVLPLIPSEATLYLPKTKHNRLFDSELLYEKLKSGYKKCVYTEQSTCDCYDMVKGKLNTDDLLLVFGSFFLVEELTNID